MTWTDRPDTEACCPGPKGFVHPDEHVALYLHSGNDQPDTIPFERGRLTGTNVEAPSNVCGEADGVSVDRTIGLSDADLIARAASHAASKPNRTSAGAKVAAVTALRNIRREGDADQVVFVYDDPMADNDAHAVIRLKQGMDRPEFTLIRRQIIDAFSRRVA